jgi:hypothetical protein
MPVTLQVGCSIPPWNVGGVLQTEEVSGPREYRHARGESPTGKQVRRPPESCDRMKRFG